MRQEMHRDCTGAAASGVRAGTTVRQEIAGRGSVRAESGTRRVRARLPTGPEDWAFRGGARPWPVASTPPRPGPRGRRRGETSRSRVLSLVIEGRP